MGLFGIGIWQSVSGGTTYSTGTPSTLFQNSDPDGGVYGGTYGFVLYTNIRAPQETTFTPAGEIGMDTTGVSVVRGYPQILWQYNQLRPDYWYYLKYLYKLSGRNYSTYQYLVLLQYPDANQGNALTQVLARWDPPVQNNRIATAYTGIQLHFSYVDQTQLAPGTPIVVVS